MDITTDIYGLQIIQFRAEQYNTALRKLIQNLVDADIPEDLASDYIYGVIGLERLLQELEKERKGEKIKTNSGQ